MRPPILFITVAFGVGLWLGLDCLALPSGALPGEALWSVALPVVAVSAWLARRAPLGAAIGIIGAAGILWGRTVPTSSIIQTAQRGATRSIQVSRAQRT